MPARKKLTPERYCEYCGKKLERKRLPNGDLEYFIHFNRRKYCDRICMAMEFDSRHNPSVLPSSGHHHARQMMTPGLCERCGAANASDVHHRDGNPQNNLQGNLMRICRSCHMREHRKHSLCVICGKRVKGFGYCEKHYIRFKKHGDPLYVAIHLKKKCTMCDKPANARGLCGKHYMQLKRSGNLPNT